MGKRVDVGWGQGMALISFGSKQQKSKKLRTRKPEDVAQNEEFLHISRQTGWIPFPTTTRFSVSSSPLGGKSEIRRMAGCGSKDHFHPMGDSSLWKTDRGRF